MESMASMNHAVACQHGWIIPFTLTPSPLYPKPPYDSGSFSCDACGRRCWAFTYHCLECHFDLDPNCACLVPTSKTQNPYQLVQCLGHPHSLLLCTKIPNSNVPCSGCNQVSKGWWVYVCLVCHCLLDETCAEWPSQIQHPFHPQHPLTLLVRPNSSSIGLIQCGVCGNVLEGFVYHCSECNFGLDVSCTSLMPTQNQEQCGEQEIQPFKHQHPLILCENTKDYQLHCSGCKQPIKGRWVYVCLQCNCLLNESCAKWPSQIQHPLHPQHPLSLLVRPSSDLSRCSACGNVIKGFVFQCRECDFCLDVFCTSLMPIKTCQEGGGLQFQQLGHLHALVLCEKINDFHFSCFACQLWLEDSICVCLECGLLLHKSCANLPRDAYFPLYHRHSLTLLESNQLVSAPEFHPFHTQHNPKRKVKVNEFNGHFKCLHCRRYTTGFAYACRKCSQYFDIRCVIKYNSHRHPRAIFNMKSNKLICKICGRSLQTPFFRCVDCNFNLHVDCVPILPQTVKHITHRHTVTLTKSPVKDHPDEDETAEFYCDACEETRELFDPTYYCKECHFVTHVHGVVSEALQVLVEDWSLAVKLGEHKGNTGNGLSKALMIEELIEQKLELENHGGTGKADQMASSSSTMVFSGAPADNQITVIGVLSVAVSNAERARFSGDTSLIELDEEVVILREKVECLDTELWATQKEKGT